MQRNAMQRNAIAESRVRVRVRVPGNNRNGHRQRVEGNEKMQVGMGERDHLQRFKDSPGKEEMQSGWSAATLHCNRR